MSFLKYRWSVWRLEYVLLLCAYPRSFKNSRFIAIRLALIVDSVTTRDRYISH